MNLSRLTQRYIRSRPSIGECIDRGLINYSALAREICETEGVKAFDAVLVACRRYYAKRKPQIQRDKKIMTLIRKSRLRVRNKLLVAVIEKSKAFEKALDLQVLVKKQRGDFTLIEGEDTFTVITNSEYLDSIKEMFAGKIRRITKDLAQITMLFDDSIETTPGVVAYLYRLLAEHSINIREEMSCWTDVMIVIDEKDISNALEVLSI